MMQGIPVRQIYWVPVLLGLLWGVPPMRGNIPIPSHSIGMAGKFGWKVVQPRHRQV